MLHEFEASRVSGDDNAVFPDKIIIDDIDEEVTYRKEKVIGCKEVKIRFDAIGCVSVEKHLIFADVTIETKGGRTITARGFTRSDADEIVELIG